MFECNNYVCRANTTYYGGYHNKHRVINWLWEIVEKDFNESEKSAFLKVNKNNSILNNCSPNK
jgi:hypothetical protein